MYRGGCREIVGTTKAANRSTAPPDQRGRARQRHYPSHATTFPEFCCDAFDQDDLLHSPGEARDKARRAKPANAL